MWSSNYSDIFNTFEDIMHQHIMCVLSSYIHTCNKNSLTNYFYLTTV